MELEAEVLFMVEIGSTVFFFLFLPLMIALATVGRIWRDNRGTGTIFGTVILWTLVLFGTLFAAFAALLYAGNQGL